MKILAVLLFIAYLVCNFITARVLSAREMREDFVEGQCLVGRICANIFYLPAWMLKLVRFIVLAVVK